MDDLLRRAKIDFTNKKPKDVAERLKRMRDTAELSRRNGEVKPAYIMLKRWMSSVEWIRKTKHHKENPSYYDAYINNKQVEDVRTILGELERILTAQLAPKMPKMEVDDVIDTSLRSVEGTLNLPETPTDEPLAPETEEFISCQNLFQLMRQNDRWLIIDTRPEKDYCASRIKADRCINIPEEKIKPGVIASHFEKLLCNDKIACHLFKQRSAQYCDTVVLLDRNSTPHTLFPGNRARSMKDILQCWDPSVKPAKIMILNGGYIEWLNRYPAYVTNPNAKAPDIETNAMDEILEEVKYAEWLTTDESSSPFHSLRIQPLPSRNSKPNIHVKSINEITMDQLKNDEETSSYNTDSVEALNNHENQSNMFTNENDINRDPYNVLAKRKSEMSNYARKIDNEDAESMHTDEDEIVPQTTNPPNKLSIHDMLPKPRIDRSSKPSSLTPQYADCKNLLTLLSLLYDLVKSQERIENQILSNEREWQLQDIDNNPDFREIKKENLKTHNNKLELVKTKKAHLKDAMATQKIDEASMSPQDKIDIDTFNRKINIIEQRLENIATERKKLHEKICNRVQKRDLLTPINNENGVYKEPLKSGGSSTNTSLKRSHSSPNLAQNQLDDRKVPHVDRTSKPHVPVPQTPNRARTGLNNKYVTISWKDRTDRMEPVYRDVHPGITGLKNLGNSCYMNSIIQCLSNTAYLAKYFNDNTYLQDLNTTNNNSVQGQVAEEVAHVIRALWRGQYKSISPRDLKVVIGQYKLQFDSYDQQDSHEFLTFLLDWMHDDLKKTAKIRIDGQLSSAEKEWNKAMENQTSIISHLFFGQLRSSIICNTCGKSSVTYETFNSLTMTINDSKSCTLDQCVQKYVTGQTISDWKCAHCKVPREATKKFDFMKLAPIVVIHLNRFGDTDGWLQKQDTPVDFPLTGFDLKPYLVADTESRNVVDQSNHYRYSLYAMSNHYGTMERGHYTAYCKSASQNKWYKYDDQTVTEVLPSAVKSGNTTSAYLLFYTSLSNEPYGYR